MTQNEIISGLAEGCGLKKTEVKELFTELANLAVSQVKANGDFIVPKFGKLVKSKREARTGRNPATGAAIKIPAKTIVKLRIGKAMKDSIE